MTRPRDSDDSAPRASSRHVKTIVARLAALPSRVKLLIATGGFLLILVIFFQGCQNVEVTQEEALTVARSRLDFAGAEPGRAEARILRQGVPSTVQWVVVFRIRALEDSDEDFLCHASVYVNATSGVVSRDADLSESAQDCPWVPVAPT